VAVHGETGRLPHVTPVWFVHRTDTWWVGSSERNVKARNVAGEPRVSLALEDCVAPVVAQGRARIRRDSFPTDIIRAFAGKYDGQDVTKTWETGGPRVLLEGPVTRWLLRQTCEPWPASPSGRS
jgi:hypothetical protein